ncbi:DUF58 domain-containing protein [Tamilnaduibacter salinus]|uniref:DUF58 domain-containing protein n=1 Tax=Tamilnaduibacter salinus TaxID=1484056 RepID=A0A2A2I5Q1_9GAMM|nr:DUF58 domain-containing protein [Tamilnaduibacter salinus]PAV26450.1 DUF58 domain-containing protein [Tamilnaduibacter salinus]
MTDSAHPLTQITLPDLIRLQADARALRLPSSRARDSRQAGLKRSAQRGRGMAFAEVRQYQPGDDIRNIDWRVTARRQEPHTKLYEEERERPLLLICDQGDSLYFASEGAFKRVRVAQCASLLAWLGLFAGDQVGGVVFTSQRIDVLRPARRRRSVLHLLDSLVHREAEPVQTPASGDSRLDDALTETERIAHTGSRIVIISDFMGLSDATPGHITRLARHNDVTAVRIVDRFERALPPPGRYAVRGPDGPIWFDSANPAFREAFEQQVRDHDEAIERCFGRAAVPVIQGQTGDDPTDIIRRLGFRGRS